MDASVFAKMLSDPGRLDLKKMWYKYGQDNLQEFLALHKQYFYQKLPLHDFDGNSMVCLDNAVQIPLSAARVLLTPQQSARLYGTRAMEEEILSTFRIEQIDTSRESVRRILSGQAPGDDEEHRIYGMKQGLEFIADRSHAITEENLFRLYQMTIGDFLPEEDRLLPGHYFAAGVLAVLLAAVLLGLFFPLGALFPEPPAQLLRRSLVTAVGRPLRTLGILAVNLGPIALFVSDEVGRPTYAFAGAFFAFGVMALLTAKLLRPHPPQTE